MFGNFNKTMARNKTGLSFSIRIYLLKSTLYTNVHFYFILVQAFYIIIHICIDYLLSVVFRDLHDREAVSAY